MADLAPFPQAASVLQKENDFYRLADAYFQRAAADGVVHVEMVRRADVPRSGMGWRRIT